MVSGRGACNAFREKFSTGWLNLQFTPSERLINGGTNHRSLVRGNRENMLERLEWTDRTPFEIREVKAMRDGLMKGCVHEFDVSKRRSETEKAPLRKHAYYSLNEIPQ